jgi:hypothetical protein
MRFLTHILLIAVISAFAEWVWAWWMIAVVAFMVMGFTRTRPGMSFLTGFLGVALSWLVIVLWQDVANAHILSTRMAALFGLPGYPLFTVATVFIGGLVGGLSALTASYARRIV